MSKYNIKSENAKLEQVICNLIDYILFLYRKKIISERTKNDILNICKGGELDEQRRNNNVK